MILMLFAMLFDYAAACYATATLLTLLLHITLLLIRHATTLCRATLCALFAPILFSYARYYAFHYYEPLLPILCHRYYARLRVIVARLSRRALRVIVIANIVDTPGCRYDTLRY